MPRHGYWCKHRVPLLPHTALKPRCLLVRRFTEQMEVVAEEGRWCAGWSRGTWPGPSAAPGSCRAGGPTAWWVLGSIREQRRRREAEDLLGLGDEALEPGAYEEAVDLLERALARGAPEETIGAKMSRIREVNVLVSVRGLTAVC